jgi:hypothetical protein
MKKPVGGWLPIELELKREQASALGLSSRRLEDAIAKCADAKAKGSIEYPALRKEALRLRWNLLVQREAIGILNNKDLDEKYPIP